MKVIPEARRVQLTLISKFLFTFTVFNDLRLDVFARFVAHNCYKLTFHNLIFSDSISG